MILPVKAKKIPNKAGKAWLKLKTPFCAEFMIRQLITDRRTTAATPIFTNAPAEFWAFLFGSIAGKKTYTGTAAELSSPHSVYCNRWRHC